METNQGLGCAQGDTYSFSIAIQPNADGTEPDLTGASAQWTLALASYRGAPILITKTGALMLVGQAWQVGPIQLDPADTRTLPPGVRYHECKVTLGDGTVSHVCSGPFTVTRSAAP